MRIRYSSEANRSPIHRCMILLSSYRTLLCTVSPSEPRLSRYSAHKETLCLLRRARRLASVGRHHQRHLLLTPNELLRVMWRPNVANSSTRCLCRKSCAAGTVVLDDAEAATIEPAEMRPRRPQHQGLADALAERWAEQPDQASIDVRLRARPSSLGPQRPQSLSSPQPVALGCPYSRNAVGSRVADHPPRAYECTPGDGRGSRLRNGSGMQLRVARGRLIGV